MGVGYHAIVHAISHRYPYVTVCGDPLAFYDERRMYAHGQMEIVTCVWCYAREGM